MIRKIILVEEKLRSDFEDTRELFETKNSLLDKVAVRAEELRSSGAQRKKLTEEVVGQVQAMVDSALQFSGRDRVNTVTTLLVDAGGESDMDASLQDADDVASQTPGRNEEEPIDDFNPEMAWNSSYTKRKMNASFSMFKPLA